MRSSRVWLLCGLVVVAAGLMVTSWFLPWWSASIDALPGVENALIIHPYGLSHQLGTMAEMMPREGAELEMPVWFTPLMWIYLAVAIGLIFYSLWLKGRKGKFVLGGVGLSYIIVVVLAVIVAAIRTGELGMSLVGYTFVQMGWVIETGVNATLRFGYWLACGVGPLCIVLALLRDKIMGKAKLSA